ncbi:MAG: cbb3-type cytochrome c oxidase N-terminal domain-containing protein [Bacteroidota bacterium]
MNTFRCGISPGSRPAVPLLRAGACAAALMLWAGRALAQTAPADGTGSGASLATGLAALLLVIVALYFAIHPVTSEKDLEKAVGVAGKLKRYVFPPATDASIPMDHDFDGIVELDNRLPPWFNYLFGGTIVFSAVYLLVFHVFGSSPLPAGEYAEEIAAADLQRRILAAQEGGIDENTLEALVEPAALARGGEAFGKYCVSCHGAQGQGLVGPNLTDDYWIHGGGIRNVFTVIKNGVAAKGMISWQLVFTPRQMQEIASFVLSLGGTNPPGAKKPEGELSRPAPAPGGTQAGAPAGGAGT